MISSEVRVPSPDSACTQDCMICTMPIILCSKIGTLEDRFSRVVWLKFLCPNQKRLSSVIRNCPGREFNMPKLNGTFFFSRILLFKYYF